MTASKRKRRIAKALKSERAPMPRFRLRRWALLGGLGLCAFALVWRAVDQQIFETDFLQNEGQRRYLRVVEIPAHRGMITDRRGEPIAISTPVDSIWANPRVLPSSDRTLAPLAEALGRDTDDLRQQLAERSDKSFIYLRRRVNPDISRRVEALAEQLDIDGIGLQREYRRYYPAGEVFSQVLGFTDIDDHGQEGVELAYEAWLQGKSGTKRVIRDGLARVVKDVESIKEPEAGKRLALSLDRRIQFLAYRELKAAVAEHDAKSGSAVILDVHTGEILAMVNQPAFNPNASRRRNGGRLRNRAVTDVFEPGSTMKPFTVAVGLESGHYRPDTLIDTRPGFMKVGRHRVRDHHDYGLIDIATVIRKSSNVGASKIALSMEPERLWEFFSGLGFGEVTGSGFPGEASGQLSAHNGWAKIDQATLAFGYGLSVTPLQLARAYGVLAADGIRRPVTLVRSDRVPRGERVMSAKTARAVRRMMESVVSPEGTAPKAAIPGYSVAGKTGTVKKSIAGGYAKDSYQAVFAGMAPASDPRLVMVVMINEPRAGAYYGGQVAGPVFSRVMSGALRLLNIAPDAAPETGVRLAAAGDGR